VISVVETVIDNGAFGKRTVKFENGLLARQAAGQPVPSLAMAAWELDTLLRPYFQLRTCWSDWQCRCSLSQA
jgi:hypothetical protein